MRGVEPSETALNLSAQRRANARNGEFGRSDDQFIGQPQDLETLLLQPRVSPAIFRSLLSAFMGRAIDFNDQPPIEAYEVDNETPERNLPAKLCSLAPPIPDGAPNDRLGWRRVRALLAGEAMEDGARNIGTPRPMLARHANFRKKVQSRLAPLDFPSSVAHRATSSPTRGEEAPAALLGRLKERRWNGDRPHRSIAAT